NRRPHRPRRKNRRRRSRRPRLRLRRRRHAPRHAGRNPHPPNHRRPPEKGLLRIRHPQNPRRKHPPRPLPSRTSKPRPKQITWHRLQPVLLGFSSPCPLCSFSVSSVLNLSFFFLPFFLSLSAPSVSLR